MLKSEANEREMDARESSWLMVRGTEAATLMGE
jgi:hypothetical protein